MENKANTYLTFEINNEIFAISVKNVLDVNQFQSIVKVPNSPENIVGVINFRGEIIPVYSLAQILNIKEIEHITKKNIIVFEIELNNETIIISTVVNKVMDVIEISDYDIKPVADTTKASLKSIVEGIYKKENDFILIINAQQTFINKLIINL